MMSKRKVHLRPNRAIRLCKTKTACGLFTIDGAPEDTSTAVVEFRNIGRTFEATIHGTLVTCEGCLMTMRDRTRTCEEA